MISDGVNHNRMIKYIIIIIVISIIIINISRVLWSLVGKMGRKEAAFGRLHACTICNLIITMFFMMMMMMMMIVITIIVITIINIIIS